MAATLQSVQKEADAFKKACGGRDPANAEKLLGALKVKLLQFPSLPPTFQQTPNAQQELALARDVLEHAVLLGVSTRNDVAFERNFLQLKPYYTDAAPLLPPSQRQSLLVGLNLLRLLVANRVADFHTELELIDQATQRDPRIKFVVDLEQCLMEGAYNKILSARQGAPTADYGPFLEALTATVQGELAGCAEVAYASLDAKEAQKMLKLPSQKELAALASERGWTVEGGVVHFGGADKPDLKASDIPSLQLIGQQLSYAKELELIV
mmetsp:Transcript_1270/g.4237  ORF Transcript_1270/g.4237 Transcript_1270/m.4237 type:complete len:267 (-) Transcript_1270:145-945(-)